MYKNGCFKFGAQDKILFFPVKGLTDQHVVEVVHGAVDDPVRREGYAELVDDLVVPGLAPSAPAGPASVRVRS